MNTTTRRLALRLLLSLSLATPALAAWPAPARAQDWSAESGSSRSREIARRYRSLLDRRPAEGLILDRLLQEVGSGSGFERLLAEYLELSSENPGHFGYAAISGHLLKRAGRLEEAAEAYARAESIEPDSYIGPLGLGEVLQRLGRTDDASAAYERALERISDRFERQQVLFRLADLAFDARDFDRAAAFLERVVSDSPRDVYVRMQLADVYLEHDRLDEALAQYEAIVDLSGTNTQQRAVTTGLAGDVLMQMGRVDDAVARYRRAQGLTTRGSWLWDDLERRIVDAYRLSGDLEGLIADYESRWTRPDADQMRILAGLYEEVGRDDDALDMLRQAVARDRRNVDTRLDLVRLLERLGRLDEAADQYRAILDISDEPVHRTRLAELLRRSGDLEAGLEVLADAQRDYRTNPSALMMLADLYIRWGQRDAAVPLYERVAELEPDDADRLLALGDIYFMVGRRDDALATWQRVLEVGDDPAESHALLGYTYAGHHMIDEALAELEAARALAPDRIEYLRALAEVSEEARRFGPALDYWTELAAASGDAEVRAEARERRIDLYERQGTLAARVADAEASWASGGDPEQGRFLGQAYLRQGRFDEAELVFLGLLEVDPDDQTALLALADIYEASQRIDEAIAALARVAERSEWSPREHYDRIVELALRGYDAETAVRYANLAIQGDPYDAAAHARLGRVYRQLGALDRAALALTEAVRIDRRAYRFVFDLAEVYVALGQREEAADLYRDVVANGRDESTILRAGRRAIEIQQSLGDLGALLPEWVGLVTRPDYEVVSQRLFLELVERLVDPARAGFRDGLPDERAAAVESLRALGGAAGRGLVTTLSSDSAGLAAPALRHIGATGYAPAAPAVAALLGTAGDDTAAQAAITLGQLRADDSAAALVAALRSGAPTTQAAAAWALGETGGQGAIVALTDALGGSTDPDTRALAALSLGRLGAEGAVAALEAAAAGPGVAGDAALWALGSIAADEGRATVLAALDAEDPGRRAIAAAALGHFPYESGSIRALLRAYWSDEPRVRWAAARSLRGLGAEAQLEPEDDALSAEPPFWQATRSRIDSAAILMSQVPAGPVPLAPSTGALAGDHPQDVAVVVEELLGSGDAAVVFRVLEDLNDGGEQGLGLGMLTWDEPSSGLDAALGPVLRASLPALANHDDAAIRDQVQLLLRSREE